MSLLLSLRDQTGEYITVKESIQSYLQKQKTILFSVNNLAIARV